MYGVDITPREWRRILIWTALILAAGCVPYLAAWLATPAGYHYSGIVANPWDAHSYLAKMRQGWLGSWQFHLAFTPEPHDGTYVFLYYLALGHLARLTGLSLAVVFHAARLLGGLALYPALYAFIARVTPDPRERTLAFWLAAAGAGFGWLSNSFGIFAIDLWVPEAFNFYSTVANPHFPLALALMLVILAGVAWPAPGVRGWPAMAAAGLALALVQPFALVPVAAALGLYLPVRGWRDRAWLPGGLVAAGAAALAAAPVMAYDYFVYGANPALAGWAAQNVAVTPSPAAVLLGFGLLAILAVPGAIAVLRKASATPGELLLVVWAAAALGLAYVPLSLQRRFLMGLGTPLAVLAALGLTRWLLPRLAAPQRRQAAGLCVAMAGLGSAMLLFILTVPMLDRNAGGEAFAMVRLGAEEHAAMAWLQAHAADEVVLAAPRTGAFLPGEAGVRAFAGHPLETVDAEAKMAQATAFFDGRLTSAEWQALKERYGIHYVYAGPAERALGGAGWLSLIAGEGDAVYRQDEVTIYRLR